LCPDLYNFLTISEPKYPDEQLLNFDKVVKDNIHVSDTSKKIIKFINEKIFKSKLFLNSYFFQTLKIILLKKLEINQKGNYFINYAGSTFYEKKTESDEKNFKIKMSKALLRFINLFDELSIKINNLYLIPDPAELDLARFERDLMISSFSENNIDLNFKFKVLKYSCLKVKINCYDFRDILTVDDYYKIDNHLKKSGTEKIVNFIKNLYKG
ncbi:hypothetical protein IDG51_03245, partial [Pelagibacterales bacterium SAG-MED14]|nr:hypothetical protein [Pelagibacterales bacterium SAG-MED14]